MRPSEFIPEEFDGNPEPIADLVAQIDHVIPLIKAAGFRIVQLVYEGEIGTPPVSAYAIEDEL